MSHIHSGHIFNVPTLGFYFYIMMILEHLDFLGIFILGTKTWNRIYCFQTG